MDYRQAYKKKIKETQDKLKALDRKARGTYRMSCDSKKEEEEFFLSLPVDSRGLVSLLWNAIQIQKDMLFYQDNLINILEARNPYEDDVNLYSMLLIEKNETKERLKLSFKIKYTEIEKDYVVIDIPVNTNLYFKMKGLKVGCDYDVFQIFEKWED